MNRRMVRVLLSASFAGIFAAAGCGRAPKLAPENTTNLVTQRPTSKPPLPASPTTGRPVTGTHHTWFAAVVENFPAARPQTGLSAADIVYEMEAEGTITRYLALFHDTIPANVGPMRSARPYLIQTAADWGAPFIHFGGSPEADALLKTYPDPQIDGIFQGQYFYRDASRVAPHNAYLITSRLPHYDAVVDNGHFRFGSPRLSGAMAAVTLDINYNSFTDVQYVYQPATNRYLRFQQGQPDRDRATGQQLYATNVIVQYARTTSIPNDPKERINIDLAGPGQALYFTHGKEVPGTCRRDGNGVVSYVDRQGEMMVLSPGKTWIEVVSDAVPVTAHK